MTLVGSVADLSARLRHVLIRGDRPVAWVLGSGVTVGTIPGVERLVGAMRAALQDQEDQVRFDAAVIGGTWGERYQQASQFLLLNRDQDLINRVIRLAVLSACRSMPPKAASAAVGDESVLRDVEVRGDWDLPKGVEALGELLSLLPDDRRGPVITTNFDPALEISVRSAGGRPNLQWIDTDGRLIQADEAGVIDVIHVHGYWRRGDTLHTVHQLTRPRPLLEGSLREALRGHVVIVLGYSGWRDAFSQSLLGRAQEHQYLGMSVAWCSYSELTSADFETGLFAELATGNAATFYAGVDANVLLPSALGNVKQGLGARSPSRGLRGWTAVDAALLASRVPAGDSREGRLRFFDGAEPDWETALDAHIPRLTLADRLTRAGEEVLLSPTELVVAALGPMGEGKSVALRQAAARLVHERTDVTLYWREAGSRLNVAEVLDLPPHGGGGYLVLVSDDGDLILDDLVALHAECRRTGRTDINVWLTAHERDWRNRGAFARTSAFARVVPTQGLQPSDASLLIDAWRAAGEAGLGELSQTDESLRVGRLVDLAIDKQSGDANSLIGAMLQVRFGARLRDRVADLLQRLDRVTVGNADTLTSAFLAVALMHSVADETDMRYSPLSRRLVASMVGVDELAVTYVVVEPLGKEAAVSQHGDEIWARHRSIARAALQVSRDRDSEELPGVIRRLVAAAARTAGPGDTIANDLYAAAYIARSLDVPVEAITAAEAAVVGAPERLSYRTTLVATFRKHRRNEEALGAAAEAWRERSSWSATEPRFGFYREWATVAGVSQLPALNVLVAGLGLADILQSEPENAQEQAALLLALGVGLTGLHRQTHSADLLEALGAVIVCASEADLTPRYRRYLDNHKGYFQRSGGQGLDLDRGEAWSLLQAAVDRLRASAPEPVKDYLSTHAIRFRTAKGRLIDRPPARQSWA